MSLYFSARALRTPPSPIRRLASYAQAAEASGASIIRLNIGQPDIETPQAFFDGLKQFEQKVLAYESSEGHRELRQAWIDQFNTLTNLSLGPENLLITTGASEALIFSFMICSDPNDEVLTFDPTYANYIGFAAISGVKLIPLQTELKNQFALPTLETIAAQISVKTRAILLCNPNNPTGTVYSKEEVQRIIELCREHNLWLIIDETYREFVFDGLRPFSALELSKGEDHVIVVDSLSKRYSLCGARVGALITCNQAFLQKALSLAQARLAAPTIEQLASAYMLKHTEDDYLLKVVKNYQNRRDVLFQGLKNLDGVEASTPKGAFYGIVRLPVEDSEEFAKYLLTNFRHDNKTLFVAPAGGFYSATGRGRNKIRIAYVLKEELLTQAVELLGEALQQYRRERG